MLLSVATSDPYQHLPSWEDDDYIGSASLLTGVDAPYTFGVDYDWDINYGEVLSEATFTRDDASVSTDYTVLYEFGLNDEVEKTFTLAAGEYEATLYTTLELFYCKTTVPRCSTKVDVSIVGGPTPETLEMDLWAYTTIYYVVGPTVTFWGRTN
jgi:hypothetical protein